jgi:hypothetical protein
LEKQKESSKNPSPDTLKLEILFQLVRVAHSDKLSSFRASGFTCFMGNITIYFPKFLFSKKIWIKRLIICGVTGVQFVKVCYFIPV